MSDERKQEQQRRLRDFVAASLQAVREGAIEDVGRLDDGPFFVTGGDGETYEARYDLPLPSEIEDIKTALCGPYGRFFNEGTD